MAIKLKSALRTPQFQLALKALVFGAFLASVKIGGMGTIPVLLFLAAAFYLYARPIFQTFLLLWPFIIFIAVALIFTAMAPAGLLYLLPAVFFASLVFYLILGIKNLILIDRPRAHFLFILATLYLCLLIFLASSRESFYLIKLLAVFAAALILFNNLFRNRPLSGVLALLTAEIAFAVSFLPIGFLQSASLSLVPIFLTAELSLKHLTGELRKKDLWIGASALIFLILIILVSSRWAI